MSMKRFSFLPIVLLLVTMFAMTLASCGSAATPAATETATAAATTPAATETAAPTQTATPTETATATEAPTETATATASATQAANATATVARTGPKDVILATTTSVQDTGLLDALLPDFKAKTGYDLKPIAVGTGQALKLGEECNADVLLVHAPSSEKTFMDAGNGIDRRLVAHNYFLLVGPASDPAGIKGSTDAIEALKKIASSQSLFVSRGDDSGTNKKELDLWKKAGVDPKGQTWYQETGQGMGATQKIASEKAGYTLTDKATYLSAKSDLQLEVMVEADSAFLNIYSVIGVNPTKCSDVNADGAKAFEDYITSADTQELIGSFGIDKFGEPLFFPDAGKSYDEVGK